MLQKLLLRLTMMGGLLSGGVVDAAILYIDPANPAATDSGTGTAAAPFKTLTAALPRLVPGDALLIAAGIYREALDLRTSTLLTDTTGSVPQTRIEAMAGARVVIRGSDIVRGWERLSDGLFVKRNWTVNSQQVFVDGVALKQIGGTIFGNYPDDPNHALAGLHVAQGGIWPGRVAGNQNQLVDKSFYYDTGAKNLYVKMGTGSLDAHTVEVSTRTFSLVGERLRNVMFSNLNFEHSNTTALMRSAAVTLVGDALVLDGIHVSYADGVGVEVIGNNNIIRNGSANYCGQLGLRARGRNARVIYNQIHYNNTRGFNKWWEAGGMKMVGAGGLQDSQVSGNQLYGNRGDGIWFDWQNRNNVIKNNRVAYNSGMGVHYEASYVAQIIGNVVFANAQRGIYLPNSSDSVIAHNLVADNGLEGVVIVDDRQAVEQNRVDLIPERNYVAGNVIARNGGTALVLPGKGIVSNISDTNLYLSTTGWLTFSSGWISATNPTVAGLPQWQGLTQQDRQSWHEVLPMSVSLGTDLALKKPYPDYSLETSAASRYTIQRNFLAQPVPASIGTRPGP